MAENDPPLPALQSSTPKADNPGEDSGLSLSAVHPAPATPAVDAAGVQLEVAVTPTTPPPPTEVQSVSPGGTPVQAAARPPVGAKDGRAADPYRHFGGIVTGNGTIARPPQRPPTQPKKLQTQEQQSQGQQRPTFSNPSAHDPVSIMSLRNVSYASAELMNQGSTRYLPSLDGLQPVDAGLPAFRRIAPDVGPIDGHDMQQVGDESPTGKVVTEVPLSPPHMPARQHVEAEQKDGPPWKVMLFTINLVIGLTLSQVLPHNHIFGEVVGLVTMFCLSFIMINVGYEFEIDKLQVKMYGKDFAIAMGAAGIPWLLAAFWFMLLLPEPLPWDQSLAIAIFSAPTSAGILFSMLEAAGLKQTWLFRKARVLAIFDDLGTILLLIPIKVIIVGPQWELSIVLVLIVAFLVNGWRKLHSLPLPCTVHWTLVYAAVVTAFSESLHIVTEDHIPMEAVHLEVLLPAFTVGVMVQTGHSEDEPNDDPDRRCSPRGARQVAHAGEEEEHVHDPYTEKVQTIVSAVFMIFVGLSMPKLFGAADGSGSGDLSDSSSGAPLAAASESTIGIGALLAHVAGVSVLMILGKMIPMCFYKDEATLRSRFALSVGMCPRGEVGAGVIVVALDLGITGDAITIAVLCLALNLVMSGGFIMAVKRLARGPADLPPAPDLRKGRPPPPAYAGAERRDPD